MSRQNKLGRTATTVSVQDGFTNVRYHNTDVVSFNEQRIVLRSGGWHTATTKTRMNQASRQFNLGFLVQQKDFEWFVDFKSVTYMFEEGITLLR